MSPIKHISFLFFPLKAHPILLFTIALMAGIFTASCPINTLNIYITVGIFCVGTLIAWCTIKKPSLVLGLVFFYLSGIALYIRHVENQKAFFIPLPRTSLSLKATVLQVNTIEHPRFTHTLALSLEGIEHYKSTPCSILIYTKTKHPPEVSDTVRIKNVKLQPPLNKEFGLYLLKEGFYAATFVSAADIETIQRPAFSIQRWLAQAREKLSTQLAKKCSPATFVFISALFLGNKNKVKKDFEALKEYFQSWGVPHHLTHSGFHLLIFIFLCELLLSFIPLPFFISQLALIFFALLYCLLSWPTFSFLRALATFVCYKACIMLKEPIVPFYTLSLICMVTLFCNPLQLFFLNFQLNFAITFTLSWFNRMRSTQRHAFL